MSAKSKTAMSSISDQAFIAQLQQQAQKQALLHEKRLLPRQVDWITSIIGSYPWQVLAVASGLTAAWLHWLR